MRQLVAALDGVADSLENMGMYAHAATVDMVANALDTPERAVLAAEQSLPESSYIFPDTHASVTDGANHFPINTPGRARNALARAAAFDRAPKWYKGSLTSFKNAVKRAVKIRASKRGKNDAEWSIEVSED